jgi:hypothetical protein
MLLQKMVRKLVSLKLSCFIASHYWFGEYEYMQLFQNTFEFIIIIIITIIITTIIM